MSQLAELDAHFSRGGSLTVAEALVQFGVYALSQRCGELAKAPYYRTVYSEWVKITPRTKVKRYYYHRAPQQLSLHDVSEASPHESAHHPAIEQA